jgi:hypothetical protein
MPSALDEKLASGRTHDIWNRNGRFQRTAVDAELARQVLIVGALVHAARGPRDRTRQQ